MPPLPAPPVIFDRALALRRLNRAAAAARPGDGRDFLIARAAEELADRLSLVKRRFSIGADIGSPGPHAAAALSAGGQVDLVVRLAPTALSAGAGDFLVAVADLERLPLGEERFNLAVSLLAMQSVNDLPGALVQIRRALKGDGLFMAALVGGESLNELRHSLTAAECEVLGGASPRVAPFVDVRTLGALAQRAGLALSVVDLDRVTVRYADILALMADLRAFGAANSLTQRSRTPLRREVLARAGAFYAQRFADPDGLGEDAACGRGEEKRLTRVFATVRIGAGLALPHGLRITLPEFPRVSRRRWASATFAKENVESIRGASLPSRQSRTVSARSGRSFSPHMCEMVTPDTLLLSLMSFNGVNLGMRANCASAGKRRRAPPL